MKSLAKHYIGILLGWIGMPGIVRECTYIGEATRARVSVRIRPLFTVITVNGIDVYFTRLTGSIDGTGMNDDQR